MDTLDILYVGKSRTYQRTIAGLLRRDDIEARFRVNYEGIPAMRRLTSGYEPGIIIADAWSQPGGIPFLKAVAELYPSRHDRILLVPSNGLESAREWIEEQGIEGVITRILPQPFSLKELQEVLASTKSYRRVMEARQHR
jgi:hypothetical protein